jgi:alpha-tubulin suppressor-like RCC1 family protein
LRKPKRVEFRQGSDIKVAFVAAGTKHTLCLDTEGKLWYFGLKESVGIKSYEPKQYEPIRLGYKEDIAGYLSFREGIAFVAASDLNNYVLTVADSKLFNFGIEL